MKLHLELWGYTLILERRETPDEEARTVASTSERIPVVLSRPRYTGRGVQPWTECSVCHIRSTALDVAGERCLARSSGGSQCGGVMVERPYDRIYGTGWPGDVPSEAGGGR